MSSMIRNRAPAPRCQRPMSIPPLYGLILVGGRSSRMKEAKWKLHYHGKTQMQYCRELLQPFCKKIFVSCRKEQKIATQIKIRKSHIIHDTFKGMGPLGGILSAMKTHPSVAWLVLACDLPFLKQETIIQLVTSRSQRGLATAFSVSRSPHFKQKQIEPLCAIYEPAIQIHLKNAVQNGCLSPKTILSESNVKVLRLRNPLFLANANHPKERELARTILKNSKTF